MLACVDHIWLCYLFTFLYVHQLISQIIPTRFAVHFALMCHICLLQLFQNNLNENEMDIKIGHGQGNVCYFLSTMTLIFIIRRVGGNIVQLGKIACLTVISF